jgi:hypothetical protein
MRRVLLILSGVGGCWYSHFDAPAPNRNTCMEYQDVVELDWDEPTRLGFTPRDKVEETLALGTFVGRLSSPDIEVGESIAIRVDFSEQAPTEIFAPPWTLVPEGPCRFQWQLQMPVSIDVAFDDSDLDISGIGRNAYLRGERDECGVSVRSEVRDEGRHRRWYDLVDAEMNYGVRPQWVRPAVYWQCGSNEGRLAISYLISGDYGSTQGEFSVPFERAQ